MKNICGANKYVHSVLLVVLSYHLKSQNAEWCLIIPESRLFRTILFLIYDYSVFPTCPVRVSMSLCTRNSFLYYLYMLSYIDACLHSTVLLLGVLTEAREVKVVGVGLLK